MQNLIMIHEKEIYEKFGAKILADTDVAYSYNLFVNKYF